MRPVDAKSIPKVKVEKPDFTSSYIRMHSTPFLVDPNTGEEINVFDSATKNEDKGDSK